MKKIFIIDWVLIPTFLLSAYTGIELHVAGHGSSHELWHNWSVAHVVTSFCFTIAAIVHIRTHLAWYRNLIKNGVKRKSRVTMMVTLLFVAVASTGISLLGVEGANSHIGLWHYELGLVAIVFFAGHTLKRLPLLRKSLQPK